MPFGPQVDRWRWLAAELAGPIPVDLVLGIIWNESRGVAGAIGGRKTKCAKLPSSSGPRKVCHALGLMQVVPRNVASWNKGHAKKVSFEDLTGSSTAAARIQIRLGVAVLRSSLVWLRSEYGFPWPPARLSDDQIKIGLMVYAWGPGNMAPYLDELAGDQVPITAAAIAARWPELGKPANQPIVYSRKVWNKVFGAGELPPAPALPKKSGDGLGWGILAIAAVAAIASR